MKGMIGRILYACVAVALVCNAAPTLAQWQLDGDKSALNFVSIKNDGVGEVHSFGSLSGTINAAGAAELNIDLGSVQTAIDIRNQRMQEMLFETVKFPTATVTAAVDPALLDEAAGGSTVFADVSLTLALHGASKTFTVPMAMVGGDGRQLQVFTLAPVLIDAADFGLVPGVEALRKVAGLKAISTVVPVTVHLVFDHAG